MKNQAHEKEVNKLQMSEVRHLNNIKIVNEENERKLTETYNESFKKYVNFYWNRKNRDCQIKEKFKKKDEKYSEKVFRLEEIEKNKEEKRNQLMKKFQLTQNSIRNNKSLQNYSMKKKLDILYSNCYSNREKMKENFNEEREDLLEYQAFILERGGRKDSVNQLKKNCSTEQTVLKQLKFERNLKPFYKIIDDIKSDSILKLSLDKRRKLFKDKKREEAEKRKRELEEKLLLRQK